MQNLKQLESNLQQLENNLQQLEDNLPLVELMPGYRYKFYYKNTTQTAIVQILTVPNGRSNFVRALDITNQKARIIDLDRIAKIQIVIERSNILTRTV